MSWYDEQEVVLEGIRENAIILKKRHTKNYLLYKSTLKYYKIPIIILSALNSVASVGLDKYLEQKYISGGTCLISLLVGIIGSIQMYLGLEKSMESSLVASKDYYSLATDIFTVLSLRREHRSLDGKEALEKYYNTYHTITEKANVIQKKYVDAMFRIPNLPNNNDLRINIPLEVGENSSDSSYSI
jgi:hypothetical protein